MRRLSWISVLMVIVWGGTIMAILGFVAKHGTLSSFLWPLPLLVIVPGIVSVGQLSDSISETPQRRLAVAATITCILLWSFIILSLFDFDLPGESGSLFKKLESSFVAATAIFSLWGCFFVPVQCIEPVDRPIRVARTAALWAASGLAVLWFLYAINETFFTFSDTGWNIALTVATLLTSGVALSLPLLLLRKTRCRDLPDSAMQIPALLCPRCGTRCDTAGAASECAACNLPIQIDAREPRCACGYLLANLKGNTCPECGRAFAARVRYEMVRAMP